MRRLVSSKVEHHLPYQPVITEVAKTIFCMIHPKEIEAISRKVISLVQALPTDNEKVSKRDLSNYIDIQRRGIQVLLFNSSLSEYKEILERLLIKNKLTDRVSEKYVSSLLKDFICEQIEHEHSLEAASKTFSEKLKKLERACKYHVVYLPLDGFFMYEEEVEALELGQIYIEKLTEPKYKKILYDFNSILLENPYYTPKEKEDIIKKDEERLHKAFFNRVCIKFNIEAEEQRAIELSIEKTQDALDLLRYAIPKLYPRSNHELRIGINGEAGIKQTTALALSNQKDSSYLSLFSRSTKTFDINKSTLDKLKRIGVFKVADILKK